MSPSDLVLLFGFSVHLMAFPNHINSSSLLSSYPNQDSFNQNLSTRLSPLLPASRFQPAMASPWFPLVPIPLVPLPEVVPSSQVLVVPQLRGHEYSIIRNSHPYQGEEIFNSTPQVGNQSVGSLNSSGWACGFTSRIQDSPTVRDGPLASQQGFRTSGSPSLIRAPEVQVSDYNSFQRNFTNAQFSLDRICFVSIQ